eukprot:EG_transcript_9583
MRLLFDLWADALHFLPEPDLLRAELSCRRAHRAIVARAMWKPHFLCRCAAHGWLLPKEEPPEGWKLHYYTVQKQVAVLREPRNAISGRFVWRCLQPAKHLPRHMNVTYSPTFSIGASTLASPPTQLFQWRIVLQRFCPPAAEDKVGVFLEQVSEGAAHCTFALSVLPAGPEEKAPLMFSGTTAFCQRSTSGWLFPTSLVLTDRDEVVVEADMLVYTADTSCVPSMLQLLGLVTVPNWLQHAVVSGFGVLSQYHARGQRTKSFLQAHEGGPRQLLRIMQDPTLSSQLRIAAAGSVQNILDTSELALPKDTANELINVVCHAADGLVEETDDAMQAEAERSRELKFLLLNSLVEVLWNLVVVPDFRRMLAAQPSFFPLVAHILPRPKYSQSHVSCLHLLAVLHRDSLVPAAILPLFRHHLQLHLQPAPDRPPNGPGPLPRALLGISIRDIVDFFAPMLWSGKLECIAFGAWYLLMYYYHDGSPLLGSF